MIKRSKIYRPYLRRKNQTRVSGMERMDLNLRQMTGISRWQFRIGSSFATRIPFDGDPRTLSDLERDQSSFMVRRARTKMRGHAYHSWLKYYLQYDWSDPILRDFNLSVDKYKWASLDVGRQKVVYNDERKTSSGNQQFVNRSIVNDIFTVDRQQGVQLYGNLFPDTLGDFTYYLGVFTGLGVGERNNDDDNLMYNVRLAMECTGRRNAIFPIRYRIPRTTGAQFCDCGEHQSKSDAWPMRRVKIAACPYLGPPTTHLVLPVSTESIR